MSPKNTIQPIQRRKNSESKARGNTLIRISICIDYVLVVSTFVQKLYVFTVLISKISNIRDTYFLKHFK